MLTLAWLYKMTDRRTDGRTYRQRNCVKHMNSLINSSIYMSTHLYMAKIIIKNGYMLKYSIYLNRH